MTHNEAKFLLRAYRPNGRDASDPRLAEALALAENDPELATWFAREQAHAASVAAKLHEIVPPAALRETILAGLQAGNQRAAHRRWWRRRVSLGLAAGLAVLLGVAAWWRFAPIRGATFEEYAANVVDRGFFLQERNADVARLKAWLAARDTPLPGKLPPEFARLRALGCRTLNYDGRDVSLICFERDGKEYHVFVARRSELPNAGNVSPSLSPNLELPERHGHVVAAWSDAINQYVLVSDASADEVRRLL